ncbi:GNAT family N-acetyltransferase [Pseudalkalibacillus sp. Hm43]|uniref:GNAT family N-acetyltransferase n=1 Tax=Pseudalkalibacillus sp. Hm43 TaxID=3450742 RepID=UPI003F425AA8
MEAITFTSARKYAEYAHHDLYKQEALNNLPIGILNRCVKQEQEGTQTDPPPYFLTIQNGHEPVLYLLMTPPYKMGVFGDPLNPKIKSAVEYAIDYLLTEGVPLPGVIGEKSISKLFATIWAEKTGKSYKMAMDQRIYKLTKVKEDIQRSGKLRLATFNDLDVIKEWGYQFSFVTENPFTKEQAEEKARQFIQEQSVYLWLVNDEPVSMARKARGTKNGVSVNFVYTPPEHQRKGYATACVTELSDRLLNEGYSFCTLYTDLSNPTSNSIYQKIGYNPIGDSVVFQFDR